MRGKGEREMATEHYFFLRSILIEWYWDAVLLAKPIVSHDLVFQFGSFCVEF